MYTKSGTWNCRAWMFLAALCAELWPERECSWLRSGQSASVHGCVLARARVFMAAHCAERECSWLRSGQSASVHSCPLARARVFMAVLWPERECSWLRSGQSPSAHGQALVKARVLTTALVCRAPVFMHALVVMTVIVQICIAWPMV